MNPEKILIQYCILSSTTIHCRLLPLNVKCLTKSIVYKAEFKSDQDTMAFIGSASNTFNIHEPYIMF